MHVGSILKGRHEGSFSSLYFDIVFNRENYEIN